MFSDTQLRFKQSLLICEEKVRRAAAADPGGGGGGACVLRPPPFGFTAALISVELHLCDPEVVLTEYSRGFETNDGKIIRRPSAILTDLCSWWAESAY